MVESVVWRSDALVIATPGPSGSASAVPSGSPANSGIALPSGPPDAVGSGSGVGPTSAASSQPSSVTLGNDGVPVTFDGQRVYRASIPPKVSANSSTFLLGGVLSEVIACTDGSASSSCYWVVDGLILLDRTGIPSAETGKAVVVSVEVSKTVGTCVGNPCGKTQTLVVTGLLWTGAAVSIAPPPVAMPSLTPPPPAAVRS